MTGPSITCPACGERSEEPIAFGKPPTDGSPPKVACICDCGAVFVVRLLDDGPRVLDIDPARMLRISMQPAFGEMFEAWARAKGLIP